MQKGGEGLDIANAHDKAYLEAGGIAILKNAPSGETSAGGRGDYSSLVSKCPWAESASLISQAGGSLKGDGRKTRTAN